MTDPCYRCGGDDRFSISPGEDLLEAEDAGYGKAVVAFTAYGLDSGGGEAGIRGESFEKVAGSEDGGIGGVGVDDEAVADDVVGEDEDEVEGVDVLGVELGEGVEGRAEAEFDDGREAGTGDVGEGDLGVFRVELEGDKLAAGRERAG